MTWERERGPIKASSCRTLGSRSMAALGRMEANDPDELGPLGLSLGDGLPAPLHLRVHEPLLREDRAACKDVVDRAADLVGEDGERLALAVLALEASEQLLPVDRVAQEGDGGLGEGPLQMHVALLSTSGPELLARRLVSALDEPRVGGELLDAIEAMDVVDLVEDRERQDLADTGDGAEAMEGVGIVTLGGADDVELERGDEPVVVVEQGEIDRDALAYGGVGEVIEESLAVGGIGDAFAPGLEIVLVERVLDVSEELAALADEVKAAAQEVPGGPHGLGVDVGLGQHAAAQQHGDLVGIDLVVLGLAAVDGLRGQGVAEDEGDAFLGAQVGEPVPGEHALSGDDEIFAVRSDDLEERRRRGLRVSMHERVSGGIEDADVQGLGVEIDAAVVTMLTVVESHGSSSCAGVALGPAIQPTRRSSRCRRGAWMRITALQLPGLHVPSRCW